MSDLFRNRSGFKYFLIFLGVSLPATHAATDGDQDAAMEAIRKLGGLVLDVSELDSSKEVSFNTRGRALTDDGLAHVARLKQVALLNLRGTKVSDAGLVHLQGLTSLRRLHLEQTAITDAGIHHLSGLTNLEYLNLVGTKVSDAQLKHLSNLKKLKRLYIWQTSITEKGIARLAIMLPGLQVVGGVDFSKIPKTLFPKEEKPKPKVDLKWISTNIASDAPKSTTGLNTTVFFENKSGKRVKVIWISYNNELTQYGELEPGATRVQNTYADNTWLITDANDQPMGYFIAVKDLGRAVIPK